MLRFTRFWENSRRKEAEERLRKDKLKKRRKNKEGEVRIRKKEEGKKIKKIIQGVEDEGFYKEAFDNFDWNKSGSISTKVTYLIILIE